MDKVISYLLGDVIYTDDRKMLPVYTTFIPYNIPVPSKTAGWMLNDLKQFTVRYNKWIKKVISRVLVKMRIWDFVAAARVDYLGLFLLIVNLLN